MKSKIEEAYFKEQWREMKLRLKSFLKTGDQEDLHQFRVQVKKLRAFFTFLENASSNHKLLKNFKPVKKIYKQAGTIRDAHINLKLGNQYHVSNDKFESSQLNILENGAIEFKLRGPKFLQKIKRVQHSMLKHRLAPVSNNSANEFYKTQLEQIASTMINIPFNDELHECRKRIKTMMYNHKLVHKALGDRLQVNKEYLDELQDKIGDWHDNVLAIELFSSPEVNDKGVVTKLKRRNTTLKRVITNLSEDFWRKATSAETVAGEVK